MSAKALWPLRPPVLTRTQLLALTDVDTGALARCSNWFGSSPDLPALVEWSGTEWTAQTVRWSAWLILVLDSGTTYWIGSSSTPTALIPNSVLVVDRQAIATSGYTVASNGQKITFDVAPADAADIRVKGQLL
jgi:hypothetical protein